jgi:hypothetical protein
MTFAFDGESTKRFDNSHRLTTAATTAAESAVARDVAGE